MERRRTEDNDRGERRGGGRDDRDDDRRGSSRGRDERDRDDGRGGRDRERDRDDRGDRDRGGRDGGRSFEYQKRDPALLRERERDNSKFDQYLTGSVKMWKPNDGENCIRILPPTWDKAMHWGVDLHVHYGVGADRQTYLCPEKHDQGKCPICEERRAFGRDADMDKERDKEYMKQLDARPRVLVYLVDRDHERDGVQCWAMPAGLDSDIVKITKDRRTGEVLNIDDPKNGYDITFEKTGSRDRTKYEAPAVARNSSALGRDEWLELAQANPLNGLMKFYDYEHIAREFGGGGGPSDKDRERDDRGRDERDRPGRDRNNDRSNSSSRRGDERTSSSRDRDDNRGRNDKVELTWESVHEMTSRELEDLIELERLGINAKEAKDADDLADWICDELKLEKSTRRRESSDDRSGSSDEQRLRGLRDRMRD